MDPANQITVIPSAPNHAHTGPVLVTTPAASAPFEEPVPEADPAKPGFFRRAWNWMKSPFMRNSETPSSSGVFVRAFDAAVVPVVDAFRRAWNHPITQGIRVVAVEVWTVIKRVSWYTTAALVAGVAMLLLALPELLAAAVVMAGVFALYIGWTALETWAARQDHTLTLAVLRMASIALRVAAAVVGLSTLVATMPGVLLGIVALTVVIVVGTRVHAAVDLDSWAPFRVQRTSRETDFREMAMA